MFAGENSKQIFKEAYIEGGFDHSAFYLDDNTYLMNTSELFYNARISYGGTLSLRFNTKNFYNTFAEVMDLTDLSLDLDSPQGSTGVSIMGLTTRSSITKLTLTLPNGSYPNTYGASSYTSFAGNNIVDLTINVINDSASFVNCVSLSQDSVNNIINALIDVTAEPKTLTFSTQVQSYVTEEQKTAATAKGWTINFA